MFDAESNDTENTNSSMNKNYRKAFVPNQSDGQQNMRR